VHFAIVWGRALMRKCKPCHNTTPLSHLRQQMKRDGPICDECRAAGCGDVEKQALFAEEVHEGKERDPYPRTPGRWGWWKDFILALFDYILVLLLILSLITVAIAFVVGICALLSSADGNGGSEGGNHTCVCTGRAPGSDDCDCCCRPCGSCFEWLGKWYSESYDRLCTCYRREVWQGVVVAEVVVETRGETKDETKETACIM